MTGADDFGIHPSDEPSTRCHVAFVAPSRAAVDAAFAAAIAAGGRIKSAPALPPEYHPTYYAACVWDPDGNNIEAVHHGCPAPRRDNWVASSGRPPCRAANRSARPTNRRSSTSAANWSPSARSTSGCCR